VDLPDDEGKTRCACTCGCFAMVKPALEPQRCLACQTAENQHVHGRPL